MKQRNAMDWDCLATAIAREFVEHNDGVPNVEYVITALKNRGMFPSKVRIKKLFSTFEFSAKVMRSNSH